MISFNKSLLILTLAGFLFMLSCSNPAESNDEHNHATGAVLLMDGEEVARYWNQQVTGTLEVSEGEQSPLITLYFLDEEGDRFLPEGTDFSLNWGEIDTTVAEIRQPEDVGTWSFHLVGVNSGETSVQLHMWHTDGDHSDFFTPGIPISVN